MRTISLLAAVWALAVVACADDDGATKPVSGSDNPAITSDSVDKQSLTLTTDEVSLDPGQERYLCFATTLDEDAVIEDAKSGCCRLEGGRAAEVDAVGVDGLV